MHTKKALTLVYLPTVVPFVIPSQAPPQICLCNCFFFHLFVCVLASFVGHPAEPLYSVPPLPNCGAFVGGVGVDGGQ